jgi:hypothetical protein
MKYKRRFGDRYDGRLIRNADLIYKIVPYIMKTRVESQNLFDYEIDITNIEGYLREKRNEGIKRIGIFHIIIAAMVRCISQKPKLNRFIAGQRVYARNEIAISFAIKKSLRENGAETTVKLIFKPTDTIYDVVERVNGAISENKQMESENETDKMAKLFSYFPRLVLSFFVWIFVTLDYYGTLPGVIHKASPFHSSVFITDLGSLGIQPVYHHTYNFGTNSIFLAFGAKQSKKIIDKDNNIVEKKVVNLRVTTDERTVDGYYYATAFKLFNRLLQHPERLDVPPEKIFEDVD